MALVAYQDGTYGVDWRDEIGVRRQRKVGTLAAAQALDARLKAQAATARTAATHVAQAEILTVRDAHALYLAHVAMKPNTRATQHQRMEAFFREREVLPIGQVMPQLLVEHRTHRVGQVSPGTVTLECAILKRVFAWLVQQGYLLRSPAEDLASAIPPSALPRCLTYEEERKALDAITERTQRPAPRDCAIRLSLAITQARLLAQSKRLGDA